MDSQSEQPQNIESPLNKAMDALNIGIHIIDHDLRYRYLNKTAETHSQNKKENLINQKITECYPRINETELYNKITKCMENQTPQTLENQFTYPNNQKKWFKHAIQPTPNGALILSIDIDKTKKTINKAIEEEKKYQTLINNIHDIIWTLDLQLNTTYVSPSIEKVLGYTPEERINQKVSQQLTPESLQRAQKALLAQLQAEEHEDPDRNPKVELEYYHKDGTTRWLENSITGIRNEKGELIGIQGVSRDITERKKAIKRLHQAEKLEKMKTSFIQTATHEIRTPLTSIKGYTELSRDHINSQENPTLANYFDTITSNVKRLEKLTSDLLDMQRIESNQMTLEKTRFPIQDLLSQTKTELNPILDERNQTLQIQGDNAWVNADRIRLMQVIINLITNASKYSPEEATIKIQVETHNNETMVSVIDQGVGIREEDMDKLFKPFPGINVDGVKDSTGLGLSISHGIIERHGGRIWAKSEGPNKGTKFTFTIPKIT